MTKMTKFRTLTAIEGGCKVTLFVIEMSDNTRWYTTKGGHVAFLTDDTIRSYTRIDSLSDIDAFSFYGNSANDCSGIDTMAKFIGLVKMK